MRRLRARKGMASPEDLDPPSRRRCWRPPSGARTSSSRSLARVSHLPCKSRTVSLARWLASRLQSAPTRRRGLMSVARLVGGAAVDPGAGIAVGCLAGACVFGGADPVIPVAESVAAYVENLDALAGVNHGLAVFPCANHGLFVPGAEPGAVTVDSCRRRSSGDRELPYRHPRAATFLVTLDPSLAAGRDVSFSGGLDSHLVAGATCG